MMEEVDVQDRENDDQSWRDLPWWFIAIIVLCLVFVYLIIAEPEIYSAFKFIRRGVLVTLSISVASFFLAFVIGLPLGLACGSRNLLLRNMAMFYMALIGGIPTLVIVFLVAFVLIPMTIGLIGFQREQLPMIIRGIIALALAYSVILADVIRLSPVFDANGQGISNGIQRPLQPLKRAVFPTLREKTIPAVGIVFIALLKDSSLVSVLAVAEITQRFKIYVGSTVRFQEAMFSAVFLYLILTVPLRYLLWRYEQKPEVSIVLK